MRHKHVTATLTILQNLGLPRAQNNERSALSLLALLNLTPEKTWSEAESPLIGITPIMDWAKKHYKKKYAPNTRETVRRQTMHQFVEAGIALYNPDEPSRPVNSPKAVYQISSEALSILKTYGQKVWAKNLADFLEKHQSLAKRYARERKMKLIPIQIASGQKIRLSPGKHSELIRDVIEEFGPHYVPDGALIYAGDTGDKWGHFDQGLLTKLGVIVDSHGKMPDVVLYCPKRDWLLLVEAVTSHGPVDGKRHDELARLFAKAKPGLVYVTAFPNRALMARHLPLIAWETEVWVADAPSHLIHFNGERFLGPY